MPAGCLCDCSPFILLHRAVEPERIFETFIKRPRKPAKTSPTFRSIPSAFSKMQVGFQTTVVLCSSAPPAICFLFTPIYGGSTTRGWGLQPIAGIDWAARRPNLLLEPISAASLINRIRDEEVHFERRAQFTEVLFQLVALGVVSFPVWGTAGLLVRVGRCGRLEQRFSDEQTGVVGDSAWEQSGVSVGKPLYSSHRVGPSRSLCHCSETGACNKMVCLESTNVERDLCSSAQSADLEYD